MKSGLEDRNNIREFFNNIDEFYEVSMKSGLEDRNNPRRLRSLWVSMLCLNEVRPRRPEQLSRQAQASWPTPHVSMKSGLEGRNNGGGAVSGAHASRVSMKSGLEGRNNAVTC